MKKTFLIIAIMLLSVSALLSVTITWEVTNGADETFLYGEYMWSVGSGYYFQEYTRTLSSNYETWSHTFSDPPPGGVPPTWMLINAFLTRVQTGYTITEYYNGIDDITISLYLSGPIPPTNPITEPETD